MSKHIQLISASQLRAARNILNLSREQCGKMAKISPETIKNIEHGVFKPTLPTDEKLLRFFAKHGIEFFNLGHMHLQSISGSKLSFAGYAEVIVHVRHAKESES